MSTAPPFFKMSKQKSKTYLIKVFYFSLLSHHLYTMKRSNEVEFNKSHDERVVEMENFFCRYLTSWNFAIQIIYAVVAIMAAFVHLFPTTFQRKYGKKMLEIKGYIFVTFMFPCTMFVCFMFWTLYFINREWVLPLAVDLIVPKWINHALHTTIIVPIVVEVIATKQVLPSFKSALIGLSLLMTIYNIIFFYTYYEFGRWMYGFFYVLNWQERAYFVVVNYLVCILIMKLGLTLQNSKFNNSPAVTNWLKLFKTL